MARVILLVLSLMMTTTLAFAQEKTLRIDYRPRPPEMIIDEKTEHFSGPLKDILEEAARQIGYQIQWRKAPFQRSFYELQIGLVDIVPRVILAEERKEFVAYLGPIGYQQKDIVFLVKKGQENLINSYEDLRKVRVGAKKDAEYFEQFNKDTSLRKVFSGLDDKNMAEMFVAERFDTMIVLDVEAIEKALKEINFSDYAYANYRYVQKIGNYYGMSKKSPHIGVYPELNGILQELVKSGRVKEIYKKYNAPPLDD